MFIRYITLLVAMLFAQAAAYNRNLIVVNGLGETADFVNLADSTITHKYRHLGSGAE